MCSDCTYDGTCGGECARRALRHYSTEDLEIELARRNPVEVETIPEDVMPKVGGKSFRCECGCNVFRVAVSDSSVYVCNSCQARYRGEK
jgi:hypothetical protein